MPADVGATRPKFPTIDEVIAAFAGKPGPARVSTALGSARKQTPRDREAARPGNARPAPRNRRPPAPEPHLDATPGPRYPVSPTPAPLGGQPGITAGTPAVASAAVRVGRGGGVAGDRRVHVGAGIAEVLLEHGAGAGAFESCGFLVGGAVVPADLDGWPAGAVRGAGLDRHPGRCREHLVHRGSQGRAEQRVPQPVGGLPEDQAVGGLPRDHVLEHLAQPHRRYPRSEQQGPQFRGVSGPGGELGPGGRPVRSDGKLAGHVASVLVGPDVTDAAVEDGRPLITSVESLPDLGERDIPLGQLRGARRGDAELVKHLHGGQLDRRQLGREQLRRGQRGRVLPVAGRGWPDAGDDRGGHHGRGGNAGRGDAQDAGVPEPTVVPGNDAGGDGGRRVQVVRGAVQQVTQDVLIGYGHADSLSRGGGSVGEQGHQAGLGAQLRHGA